MEDLSDGEHVEWYRVEGRIGDRWQGLAVGTAMGHKRIERFATVVVDAARLIVKRPEDGATLRRFELSYF
jgi:alpha-L-fucosidase